MRISDWSSDVCSSDLTEVPGGLIVAPPGHPDFYAVVVIGDAQPVPDRLETVDVGQGVFLLIGQIDDRRAEYRPVVGELDPSADPDFLTVPEILNRRIDVAIEAQLADHRVGLPAADDGVDLVAACRQVVLVQPAQMGRSEWRAGVRQSV